MSIVNNSDNYDHYNNEILKYFMNRLKKTQINFENSLADFIFSLCLSGLEV